MRFLRLALVPGAAAVSLALAACGDAGSERSTGEDSAMTTPTEQNGANPAADETARRAESARANAAEDDFGNLPAGDQCGASKVATFVSQKATPEVRARVAAEVGHDRIRWVGPDTAVTMDYRPDRLNVELDRNDVITGAKCS